MLVIVGDVWLCLFPVYVGSCMVFDSAYVLLLGYLFDICLSCLISLGFVFLFVYCLRLLRIFVVWCFDLFGIRLCICSCGCDFLFT